MICSLVTFSAYEGTLQGVRDGPRPLWVEAILLMTGLSYYAFTRSREGVQDCMMLERFCFGLPYAIHGERLPDTLLSAVARTAKATKNH